MSTKKRTTVYAVINSKGGVGKTTTSLLLAEGFKRKGLSTLLIDLDQQQNATKQYDAIIDDHVTVYDLLLDPEVNAIEGVQNMDFSDIIAGDALIVGAEAEMASLTCRETMLVDALEPIKGSYDAIIIDCPPTLGIVVTNALVASDKVIIPVLCDGYSLDGFKKLHSLINRITTNKRLNPSLSIEGFLITQFEKRQNLSKSFNEQLPQLASMYKTKVFSTRIRRCCKVKEAQQLKQSLYDYAPECTTAEDYTALVEELLELQVQKAAIA